MKAYKPILCQASLSILAIFILSSVGFAETVYLKNGKKVEGMIKELDDTGLVIDVAGMPLEYDLKDIKQLDILGKGETRKDVSDFIENVNLTISDDLRDEGQKEAEVMALRLENKPWHGYLVSEEARDLVVRHRHQIQLIREPSLCVYLKKLYLNWMLSRENKHDALYRGNWDEAEKFKARAAEYIDKINAELDRIRWLCGNEYVQQAQEGIRLHAKEPQEAQAVRNVPESGPVKEDAVENEAGIRNQEW